jgi:hypothetical protein
LEGSSKETVVRTERKIFFQTLYWISILRVFGVVKKTVVRKERKIFFQTLYWIFTLRTLIGQLIRRGCHKKQLSEKKEKFSFRHLYWISILRTFGVVRRNSCPKRKKSFLSDIILDFYFKNLEKPA